MIEEESKPKYYLIKILFLLFLAFLIMYISSETGYFEYKAHNRSVLTKEAMIQFEKDVADGKDVTLNDYKIDEYVDYSNLFSKIGSNIGYYTEKIMNNGIKKTLKVLSALFYE